MKDSTKGYIALFGGLAIAIGLILWLGPILRNQDAKDNRAQVTPVSRLQTYLEKTMSSQVQSVEVVRCADVSSQVLGGKQRTVQGVVYVKAYACPTSVMLKSGSGGCAGVVYALGIGGQVALTEAPTALDARYCK